MQVARGFLYGEGATLELPPRRRTKAEVIQDRNIKITQSLDAGGDAQELAWEYGIHVATIYRIAERTHRKAQVLRSAD